MPLIAISFAGYNRFDLDKQLTQFFKDEAIYSSNITNITFEYYECHICHLVYWSALEVTQEQLTKFHKKYTSNPITAGEDNKKRDEDKMGLTDV